MVTDTIAAIATASGVGGVGIIRISGDMAIEISNRVFSVSLSESHKMVLGRVIYNGQIIDEALGCYFKAPHSYTGEDVVELFCHGGTAVCKMVLEAVLANGASMAGAGEFTRRAFLNGRLDLSQAEAVGDIISAKTGDAVKIAANQLDGALSNKISSLRSLLLGVSAHLLATLDFSEEVDAIPYGELKNKVEAVHSELSELLETADDGRIIKDGINAAIIGAANVGKSSLLNAISGEDRAIVTDIEGTTRDVLEASVNIRGCRVNLLDTAGIRQSIDTVERLGIERSISAIERADIILLVLDGSREKSEYDEPIIELIGNKKTICIINKADLPRKLTPPLFENTICISAKTGEGLDELFALISKMYSRGKLSSKIIIASERHKQSLLHADSHIKSALSAISEGMPPDIILGDLELCLHSLGEVDGMTVSDEIIDNIFANFCVCK